MHFRYIYESPRFLVANNRNNEAIIILDQICKTNGKGEFTKIIIENHSQGTLLHSYWNLFSSELKKTT